MKFDYHKKKTFTNYWNNFSTVPKKNQYISNSLKNLKKKFFKLIRFKISIKISSFKAENDQSFTSYQTDLLIKEYRSKLLVEKISKFLFQSNLIFTYEEIEIYINEFDNIFYNSPIKELESGFGYNEGVFLYSLLKIIKPTLVIESGVMKGFTTYLIDAATCKDCKILCYDINFENNLFNSKKAKYINTDILENVPIIANEKVFALWDDHTSQLDRLKFSVLNKIKYNFFDDDLSFLNIHSDGWPPIPTISMLLDIKNKVINKTSFEWISRNRKGEFFLDNLIEEKSIDQIKFHKIFPELFPITGYRNHSQCSFVIN